MPYCQNVVRPCLKGLGVMGTPLPYSFHSDSNLDPTQ